MSLRRSLPYIVLTVTVAAVIAFAVYSFAFVDGLTTDTVTYRTIDVDVQGKAYIFTDCITLNGSDGVSIPECLDSALVDQGNIVARTYSGDPDSLKVIEEAGNELYIFMASDSHIEGLTLQEIDEKIFALTSQIHKAELSGRSDVVFEKQKQLHILFNKREILTNKTVSYERRSELLREKIKSISAVSKINISPVSASHRGYYFSDCSGAENILTVSALETLTLNVYDEICRLADESDKGTNAGKIITNSKWYFTVKAHRSESIKLSLGDNYKAQLDGSEQLMDVTLHRIVTDGVSDESVLIFSCNTISSEFMFPKSCDVKVICDSVSGISVPKDAIYYKDNICGVYAVKNNALKFIPVSIAVTDGEYHVVHTGENGLEMYDRVVTGGKDIYEGKLID